MPRTARIQRETRLGYALPFPRWREIERLSNTRSYGLLVTGEVDSFLIGSRRFIILDSWRDYLERQRRGEARDPAEKAAAAQRFAASAAISRAQYAPKHGPDHRIGYPKTPKSLKSRAAVRTNRPSSPDRENEPAQLRLATRPVKEE